MGWMSAPEYWLGRPVLERGIAVVYVIAFIAAARQFPRADRGARAAPRAALSRPAILPAGAKYLLAHYSDHFFAIVAWFGVVLSAAMAVGFADVAPLWVTVLLWLLLWILYLSIVNVGQTWYSFGWESLLLETGLLAIFLGNDRVAPPLLAMWLARWLLSASNSAPA